MKHADEKRKKSTPFSRNRRLLPSKMDLTAMEVCQRGWMTKSPPGKCVQIGKFEVSFLKKQWRKRYFVLAKPYTGLPDEWYLFYYKDETRHDPLGRIDLRMCKQLQTNLDSSTYQFMFALVVDEGVKERKYYLAQEAESDFNEWVTVLKKVINFPDAQNQSSVSQNLLHPLTAPAQGNSDAEPRRYRSIPSPSTQNAARYENTEGPPQRPPLADPIQRDPQPIPGDKKQSLSEVSAEYAQIRKPELRHEEHEANAHEAQIKHRESADNQDVYDFPNTPKLVVTPTSRPAPLQRQARNIDSIYDVPPQNPRGTEQRKNTTVKAPQTKQQWPPDSNKAAVDLGISTQEDIYDVPRSFTSRGSSSTSLPQSHAPVSPPSSASSCLHTPMPSTSRMSDNVFEEQTNSSSEDDEDSDYMESSQTKQNLDEIYDIPRSARIRSALDNPPPCAGPIHVHGYVNASSRTVKHGTESLGGSSQVVIRTSSKTQSFTREIHHEYIPLPEIPVNRGSEASSSSEASGYCDSENSGPPARPPKDLPPQPKPRHLKNNNNADDPGSPMSPRGPQVPTRLQSSSEEKDFHRPSPCPGRHKISYAQLDLSAEECIPIKSPNSASVTQYFQLDMLKTSALEKIKRDWSGQSMDEIS